LVSDRNIVSLHESRSTFHHERADFRIEVVDLARVNRAQSHRDLPDLPTFLGVGGVVTAKSQDRDEKEFARESARSRFDENRNQQPKNEEAGDEWPGDHHQKYAGYRKVVQSKEQDEKSKNFA